MAQLANPNQWIVFVAFSAGMTAAIFVPGKRLNMAALLYQLLLYPLFDLAGVLSGIWF